jgi:hypothetical protein
MHRCKPFLINAYLPENCSTVQDNSNAIKYLNIHCILCHKFTIIRRFLKSLLGEFIHYSLIFDVISQSAEIWITTGNQEKLLTREADLVGQSSPANGPSIVTVDRQFTQQRIKGFGAALSNSAAYLFYSSPQREEVCCLTDVSGSALVFW